MKLIRTLAASATVLAFTASAALAESIIRCTWDDNTVWILKIEGERWHRWSDRDWQWNELDCYEVGFSNAGRHEAPNGTSNDRLSCANTITEAEYRRTVDGAHHSRFFTPSGRVSHTLRAITSIDRLTGRISYYEREERTVSGDAAGLQPVLREDSKAGGCEQTTDPVLSPRPAPRL